MTSQEPSEFEGNEDVKLQVRQNSHRPSASDGSILDDELECQEIQTASFPAPHLGLGRTENAEAGIEIRYMQSEKTGSPANKGAHEASNDEIHTLR